MAEEFKHAKDLFNLSDGSTMVFFMRPCSQRQELRPLIESGGGKVTSKVIKGSVKLAEKGSVISANDYIDAKYIKDCVNQNQLLPMDSYRVESGSRVRNASGNSNVSIQSFGSGDSLSPASYIVQTSARDFKGRSKYTKEDDIAMITFLIDEKRYSEALGLRVWKDMEIRKITSHSASSMNTRYRKHILPNLEKYKFDVDRRWLAKLAGGVVAKETEPEFSADALFTTSKKSAKLDKTTRKVDLTGKFGDQFDFTNVEKSPEVEMEPVSPKRIEKEMNEQKRKEIVNRDKTKDSVKSNENRDIIELDGSQEHNENGSDKRNNENRRSKRLKKLEGNKENEKDITFDKDKSKRKQDMVNSESYSESVEMGNDKDKIVEERKDEVDGSPEISGESDKTSLVNSGDGKDSKRKKVNNKGLIDTKGRDQCDRKSKSDTMDNADEFEYLDAVCHSPSDIFAITDEENNTLKEDDDGKHHRLDKIKSVVNMEDGRLTLSSQESEDSSIYYDVEENHDAKSDDKQIRNKIGLRKPKPVENHSNSSNISINFKAACKNNKAEGPDKGIKQQETVKESGDPGSDKDVKVTNEKNKEKDSNKGDKRKNSDNNGIDVEKSQEVEMEQVSPKYGENEVNELIKKDILINENKTKHHASEEHDENRNDKRNNTSRRSKRLAYGSKQQDNGKEHDLVVTIPKQTDKIGEEKCSNYSDKNEQIQTDKCGNVQNCGKDGKQQATDSSGEDKESDSRGKDKKSDTNGKDKELETSIRVKELDNFDKQQGADKTGKDSNKSGQKQNVDKSYKEHDSSKSGKNGRKRQIVESNSEISSSEKDDTSARESNKNNSAGNKAETQISENAETQPPEAEICSNEVTSSGQCIEVSDNSGYKDMIGESDIESDSFDEMLNNYIKENVIVIAEGSNKSIIVDESDANSCRKKTKDGLSGKRKRENNKDSTDLSSTREAKKRKLVAECRATIKTISEKYGLSERFVRQLLFQCNSDIDRLISYIEYGPHSSDLPPWTNLDDEALKSDPTAVSLILKFGEQDVKNRHNFLNYIV